MKNEKGISGYAEAHQDGPADELDLDSLGEHGPNLTLTEAETLNMQVFEIKRQLEILVSHIEREFTAYDCDPGAALEETRTRLKRIICAYF